MGHGECNTPALRAIFPFASCVAACCPCLLPAFLRLLPAADRLRPGSPTHARRRTEERPGICRPLGGGNCFHRPERADHDPTDAIAFVRWQSHGRRIPMRRVRNSSRPVRPTAAIWHLCSSRGKPRLALVIEDLQGGRDRELTFAQGFSGPRAPAFSARCLADTVQLCRRGSSRFIPSTAKQADQRKLVDSPASTIGQASRPMAGSCSLHRRGTATSRSILRRPTAASPIG